MPSLKKKPKLLYTYDRLDASFTHGGQNQQTFITHVAWMGWLKGIHALHTLSFIQKDDPILVFVEEVSFKLQVLYSNA